jgi:aryl-alcohol dehydrogenase-like predicted oxidoreductase
MEHLIISERVDAVQLTYNILDREAENRLLPLAQDAGLSVIINRPFQGGHLFDKFSKHPLPDWAAEIEVVNWAQYFLKFIVSHPAVTTAIPATSNPEHMIENMGARLGVMPDAMMRRRMLEYVEKL